MKRVVYPGINGDLVRMAGAPQLVFDLVFGAGDTPGNQPHPVGPWARRSDRVALINRVNASERSEASCGAVS